MTNSSDNAVFCDWNALPLALGTNHGLWFHSCNVSRVCSCKVAKTQQTFWFVKDGMTVCGWTCNLFICKSQILEDWTSIDSNEFKKNHFVLISLLKMRRGIWTYTQMQEGGAFLCHRAWFLKHKLSLQMTEQFKLLYWNINLAQIILLWEFFYVSHVTFPVNFIFLSRELEAKRTMS